MPWVGHVNGFIVPFQGFKCRKSKTGIQASPEEEEDYNKVHKKLCSCMFMRTTICHHGHMNCHNRHFSKPSSCLLLSLEEMSDMPQAPPAGRRQNCQWRCSNDSEELHMQAPLGFYLKNLFHGRYFVNVISNTCFSCYDVSKYLLWKRLPWISFALS